MNEPTPRVFFLLNALAITGCVLAVLFGVCDSCADIFAWWPR